MATVASLVVNLTAKTGDFERSMQKVERDVVRTSRRLQDVGNRLTVGLTLPLVAAGGTALKFAVDFESAFAGVEKTVDGTTAQLDGLRAGIRAMAKEIPAGTTEIAKVAEAAGQLGIKTESILSFSRVMIDLGNTTNLSAEEAATALARLANITRLPQDQFDRLGSTIVALGNNLATTEAEIVQLGLRLAGAGAQVGLTQAQIMGFAAALSSVGVEAEAGGSAFSKVFVNIAGAVNAGGDGLRRFAAVANMSVGEFSTLFRTSAATAVQRFVEGLERIKLSGGDVFRTLEDLGMSEVRVRDALLRMSGNSAVLAQSLGIASDAWAKNTALSAEAAKRYQTTAARLQVLGNRAADLAITIGGALVPMFNRMIDMGERVAARIDPLARAFGQLDEDTKRYVITLGLVAAAAGPALVALGALAGAIAALANPTFLLIAAWSTLAVVIARNWQEIRDGWDTVWTYIKASPVFTQSVEAIKQQLAPIAAAVGAIQTAFNGTRETMGAAKGDIKGVGDAVKDSLLPPMKDFVAQIQEAYNKLMALGSVQPPAMPTLGGPGPVYGPPQLPELPQRRMQETLRTARDRQKRLGDLGNAMRGIDLSTNLPAPDPGPWERFFDHVNNGVGRMVAAMRSMGTAVGGTLGGLTAQLAKGALSFKQFADQAIKALAKIAAQAAGFAIGGPLGAFVGGFLGGMFADGGRPPLGKVSVVGEEGPELFVPDTAGMIVPFSELAVAGAGEPSAPPQYNFTVTGVDMGSRDAARRFMRAIADELRANSPEALMLSRLSSVRAGQNDRRANG